MTCSQRQSYLLRILQHLPSSSTLRSIAEDLEERLQNFRLLPSVIPSAVGALGKVTLTPFLTLVEKRNKLETFNSKL